MDKNEHKGDSLIWLYVLFFKAQKQGFKEVVWKIIEGKL